MYFLSFERNDLLYVSPYDLKIKSIISRILDRNIIFGIYKFKFLMSPLNVRKFIDCSFLKRAYIGAQKDQTVFIVSKCHFVWSKLLSDNLTQNVTATKMKIIFLIARAYE